MQSNKEGGAMKGFQSIILCIFLAALLAACSPIYKTEYAYVPPKSDMGKMCTANCVQQKSMCQQMCQMRNENCRARAHQDALYQYEVYKNERRRNGQSIDRSVSSFESSFGCNEPCNCSETFNTCYSACGGEVLEREVCVAFCDKQ